MTTTALHRIPVVGDPRPARARAWAVPFEHITPNSFALAAALTVHAFRRGLSFSLTWWSFTFLVGTCVTGATALGGALGSTILDALAAGLFAALVAAWIVVAALSARGVVAGNLLGATSR